jgi:hypothetical protein
MLLQGRLVREWDQTPHPPLPDPRHAACHASLGLGLHSGKDLHYNTTSAATPGACCDACSAEPGCKAWQWEGVVSSGAGKCVLKTRFEFAKWYPDEAKYMPGRSLKVAGVPVGAPAPTLPTGPVQFQLQLW